MSSSGSTLRYFCHSCNQEVTPNLQDFTCSRCQSGFIEEIDASFSQHEIPVQSINLGTYMINAMRSLLPDDPSGSIRALDADIDEDYVYNTRSRRAGRARNGRSGGSFSLQLSSQPAGVRVATSHDPDVLGVLSEVGAIMGDLGSFGPGQGVMNSLMTLLMTQMQVGPPPASDAAISELPVMELSEETVAKYKTCSICFEDYQTAERATLLPCQHVYHTTCVNTWLVQHATCPVCRKDLSGRDTSRLEESLPTTPDAPASDPPR